ncbi:MAG TPA: Mur ligase family protein [Candidatus Dormibacteraeota bacterium]|nr:Mur ligase family protein [Candidatus Dormibacteraeota bacterium]
MSGSDFPTVIAALQARGRFGVNLGLARVRALLRELGDPQRGLPGVLVGGTNGKGSVQALVAAVLAAAGLRVGQTPKPHLSSYRERLVVAGQPIEPDEFAALVGGVLDLAERVASRLGPPTEFEVLTAAAFAWFAERKVEVAVVEVGLGGRLDATNAWDGGVAAITNVEWDHMDRLGPTLAAIGREKAAIIKRGDRAVTGASGPGLAVIRRRASRLAVPLRETPPLSVVGMARDGLRLAHPDLGELRVALLGRHQAANVAVALGIIADLEATGIAAVDEAALRRGLASARWPGRLELLVQGTDGRAMPIAEADAEVAPQPGRPDIVLDGAHNESGAAALAAALDELRPSISPGRPTLLFGVMADKDVPRLVGRLAGAAALREARIVTTAAPGPRAASAASLAAAWQADERGRRAEVVPIESLDAALGLALGGARAVDGPLVVAGSLYLVGAVRDRLGLAEVAP